ncbi:DUF2314 domain-containing protein [Pseudomonas sp. UM16]|uniref:DUF2314 domain-containing protein n=1 Tax=Pseudomonas sp. UM16 TaxID=3158962 RepID=UPI00398F9463
MTTKTIYDVDGESEALALARRNAQLTFKHFCRELSSERRRIVPALDFAAVKIGFSVSPSNEATPTQENMWVSDVEFDGETIKGILINTPQWVTSLSAGDVITVPLSDLDDWMYVTDGVVYGGYTIDVIRSGLSIEERASHDAAWGLEFGAPGEILVAPASNVVPEQQWSEFPVSEKSFDPLEQVQSDTPSTLYEPEDEPTGIPLWPIGLGILLVGLFGLYCLLNNSLPVALVGSKGSTDQFLSFMLVTLITSIGLISGTGPWYFRWRLCTPQWGKSRALDVGAICLVPVIATLLQHYSNT